MFFNVINNYFSSSLVQSPSNSNKFISTILIHADFYHYIEVCYRNCTVLSFLWLYIHNEKTAKILSVQRSVIIQEEKVELPSACLNMSKNAYLLFKLRKRLYVYDRKLLFAFWLNIAISTILRPKDLVSENRLITCICRILPVYLSSLLTRIPFSSFRFSGCYITDFF